MEYQALFYSLFCSELQYAKKEKDFNIIDCSTNFSETLMSIV